MSDLISWDDFAKVDLRVGTVLSADPFPKARNPAYQLTIDFGELGVKRSSAQITDRYAAEDLVGQQVIAVVNFPEKQIANFFSQVLVLGALGPGKAVTLLQPERPVDNGSRIS